MARQRELLRRGSSSGRAGGAARGGLAAFVEGLLGGDLTIAVRCYDGSQAGPADAPATLVVRSPDALRRVLTAPGELGFGRAYVAGDIDVEGDLFAALELGTAARPHLGPSELLEVARLAGESVIHRLPPPPEEARLRGRKHSPERDAAAIAHHYDVSNAFYRMVLGPSMTYSCGVWPDADPDVTDGATVPHPQATLEEAQAAKYELVGRKLGLRPGMRLLDVGCGWGGMVRHAARHHGVRAVGITLSENQAAFARQAVRDDGLDDLVEIRVQDYRHVADGPYDAISSIGMFEHVGMARLGEYFAVLFTLLQPGGRLLNHGISRPFGGEPKLSSRGFVGRYVFPDGELHEIGAVTSKVQEVGFEVRHLESLREHYGLTLRAWVANLERNWADAVGEVGMGRARVWRLYMAGCAIGFESGRTQVHQLLAAKPDGSRSGFPLRPRFEV